MHASQCTGRHQAKLDHLPPPLIYASNYAQPTMHAIKYAFELFISLVPKTENIDTYPITRNLKQHFQKGKFLPYETMGLLMN